MKNDEIEKSKLHAFYVSQIIALLHDADANGLNMESIVKDALVTVQLPDHA